MEGVYNPSQRSASNPTASPLRASQDRSSSRERNSESNTRASYTPPVSNGAGAKIAIRKLSLSTCPAQVKNAKLVFPSPKFGEIKKLGHVVKNWKTRFFVLEGARLQYYALGKHNPDSSKFKGEMDLEGGSVTEVNEAKRLTILVHDTQMVLEFENLNVMTEWKFALKECIRIANCNSLIKGQRIPDVVSWYNEQYTLYLNAASVLRKGGMFCLHYVDARDGYVELIPIWLQENPGGTGFMMMCDHVTVQSTGPPMVGGADPSVTPTATRTRIQGLDIPYNTITSIMTGSKTEVYHTPEMGGTSR